MTMRLNDEQVLPATGSQRHLKSSHSSKLLAVYYNVRAIIFFAFQNQWQLQRLNMQLDKLAPARTRD
jgi:hypothetical protein